jgi:hypothetical protein
VDRPSERHREREQIARIEARIHGLEPQQRAAHQPRTGEKRQCQRQLDAEQHATKLPAADAFGRAARGPLQRAVDVRTRQVERGGEPAHDAGRDDYAHGEEGHRSAEAERIVRRQARGRQLCADPGHGPRRNQQAGDAAGGTEDDRLREHLSHETCAPGAESRAHRELLQPCAAAHQLQARHVHARHE